MQVGEKTRSLKSLPEMLSFTLWQATKTPGIARLAKDYALAKETDVPRVLDFASSGGE